MKRTYFLPTLLLFCLSVSLSAQIPSNVFEITSILVDGCDGNDEGKNEMVIFQVGPNAINSSDLRVDGALNTGGIQTGKWPNTANSFLGIASSPANATKVSQINSTITACGKLIEPVGGILPAGKKVLLITSTDFNPAAHSFATLNDTLYVIFQNAGNTAGHFVNFGTSSNRTLRLFHVPTSAYDQVTYDRALLIDQLGASVAADGASVSYTWSGAATYYNNGCQAPYIPLDPSWNAPASICNYAAPINLNSLITGTTGGTWSGSGVSGNTFDPSGLSGSSTITYTVGSVSCSVQESHTITLIPASDPAWDAPASVCQSGGTINLSTLVSGTTGGTFSGTGVSGGIFNPSSLSGGITITYTVGTSPCVSTEAHTIQVITSADASWTSPGTLCESADPIDLTTYITGTAGGTFSGMGVNNNAFDPSGLAGSITITYSVGSAGCNASENRNITILPTQDPSWDSPGIICQSSPAINLNTLISGDAGGTWSGTGVSGNMFNPSGLNGSISITYTVGSSPCFDDQTHAIVVTNQADAAWTAPTSLCQNNGVIDLTPFVSGTPGGTWSGSGVSGTTFNPEGLSGPINITYSAGAVGCDDTETHSIQIDVPGNPSWSSAGAYCQSQLPLALNPLISGTTGGNWSGVGVSNDSLHYNGNSSYFITYTVVNGSCASSQNGTLTIEQVEASFIANPTSGIVPLNVNFFNNSMGNGSSYWSFGNEGVSTEMNPSAVYSTTGTYEVSLIYTTTSGCKDTAFSSIFVYDDLSVFIPNVITPNGDLNNEIFKPIINNPVDQFEGIIFNRWGGEVARFDINGWDGSNAKGVKVSSGVYAYVISLVFNEKYYQYHGSLTVIY